MGEQPKCEELIDGRLAGRLEFLLPDWGDKELIKELADDFDIDTEDLYQDEDLTDEVQSTHRDRVLEDVLSVEVRKSYRVLLSWGGPSDGFDFVFNKEGELVECEYFYQDWFDGARRSVPMVQAEELVQLYCVGPDFE